MSDKLNGPPKGFKNNYFKHSSNGGYNKSYYHGPYCLPHHSHKKNKAWYNRPKSPSVSDEDLYSQVLGGENRNKFERKGSNWKFNKKSNNSQEFIDSSINASELDENRGGAAETTETNDYDKSQEFNDNIPVSEEKDYSNNSNSNSRFLFRGEKFSRVNEFQIDGDENNDENKENIDVNINVNLNVNENMDANMIRIDKNLNINRNLNSSDKIIKKKTLYGSISDNYGCSGKTKETSRRVSISDFVENQEMKEEEETKELVEEEEPKIEEKDTKKEEPKVEEPKPKDLKEVEKKNITKRESFGVFSSSNFTIQSKNSSDSLNPAIKLMEQSTPLNHATNNINNINLNNLSNFHLNGNSNPNPSNIKTPEPFKVTPPSPLSPLELSKQDLGDAYFIPKKIRPIYDELTTQNNINLHPKTNFGFQTTIQRPQMPYTNNFNNNNTNFNFSSNDDVFHRNIFQNENNEGGNNGTNMNCNINLNNLNFLMSNNNNNRNATSHIIGGGFTSQTAPCVSHFSLYDPPQINPIPPPINSVNNLTNSINSINPSSFANGVNLMQNSPMNLQRDINNINLNNLSYLRNNLGFNNNISNNENHSLSRRESNFGIPGQENTVILEVDIKLKDGDIHRIMIGRFNDLFQVVLKFCEINHLKDEFIRPIIIYIIKALNSIYGIFNMKLKPEEIQFLADLKNKYYPDEDSKENEEVMDEQKEGNNNIINGNQNSQNDLTISEYDEEKMEKSETITDKKEDEN